MDYPRLSPEDQQRLVEAKLWFQQLNHQEVAVERDPIIPGTPVVDLTHHRPYLRFLALNHPKVSNH